MSPEKVVIITAVGTLTGIALWLGYLYWNKKAAVSFRHLFLVVLIIGIVCRFALLIYTPTFYAIDEQAHFNYIKYLSENHSFPIQTTKTGSPKNDYEYYQPPLYYLLMVPIYTISMTLFHHTGITVRFIRMFSIVLWLINIWFAMKFLKYLDISDIFLKTSTMALICLLPTYTVLSSVINNDNLFLTVGGGIICLIARYKSSLLHCVIIGVLLGIAMLTKLTAVIYFALIFAILVIRLFQNPFQKQHFHFILTIVTGLFIWSPWAWRNWNIYHSITAESAANEPIQWPSVSYGISFILRYIQRSFWSVSGIYNNISSFYPYIGLLLSCFAIAGLLYYLILKRELLKTFVPKQNMQILIAMGLTFIINLILVFRFGILYGHGQGRFLFPLLFPISLFITMGLKPYPIKNFHIHMVFLLIVYTLSFTFFSIGMFPRVN